MRVLTGIQPSGNLHLGNYFGAMKRMIALQDSCELYTMIVNLHAMTTISDGKVLKENTLLAAADYLACGLDPKKAIFWVQSDVVEVLELAWVLSNFTPMGFLERCHSYKDKTAKGIAPNHGLFAYPVLMAADILMLQAEKIPVGKDQKQHVEFTRDVAIRFNNAYGAVFKIPEPVIDDAVAVIPGIDGQKMSKSYNNAIDIFGEPSKIKKKVMSIKTDSMGVDDSKNPDTCNVYNILKNLLTVSENAALRERYKTGPLSYGEVKTMLFEKIQEHFTPFRQKRDEILSHRDTLKDVLHEGARKAKEKAMPTIQKVRDVTGIAWS
jgi:tryptophanyl-tRNA synthetase